MVLSSRGMITKKENITSSKVTKQVCRVANSTNNSTALLYIFFILAIFAPPLPKPVISRPSFIRTETEKFLSSNFSNVAFDPLYAPLTIKTFLPNAGITVSR
uniref:Uncharacterized protein n=1 Tax=Romanomermis culicivorax TaxID=13658 RepID=A0A915KVL4_ROMCU